MQKSHQSLYADIADYFIQYINSLEPDKIKQLDDDIRANGRGVISIFEIQNAVELLQFFNIFYYFNGHLPLTNSLLPVPDGETPLDTEKVSLKRLYELYEDIKSHGLVLLQFLSAVNLFFGGDI